MTTPIHTETVVSPDGKIEIAVPELATGQRVHVLIEPEEHATAQPQHVIDIVEKVHGHRIFGTADQDCR